MEYYDSMYKWTGVCVDPFYYNSWLKNSEAAIIVCRQLGYEGGLPIIQRGYGYILLITTPLLHNHVCVFVCVCVCLVGGGGGGNPTYWSHDALVSQSFVQGSSLADDRVGHRFRSL